jgi:hypothetical protein
MLLSYPESTLEQEQREPETTEPRASTKIISDCSPELIHDKQEQSIPISALYSIFEYVSDPEIISIK